MTKPKTDDNTDNDNDNDNGVETTDHAAAVELQTVTKFVRCAVDNAVRLALTGSDTLILAQFHDGVCGAGLGVVYTDEGSHVMLSLRCPWAWRQLLSGFKRANVKIKATNLGGRAHKVGQKFIVFAKTPVTVNQDGTVSHAAA